MSLRDSIKDLRNAARRLDAADFNPSMNALEDFLSEIKIDKPIKPPEEFLKSLIAKFLRGERSFSSRELKALPFIIYDPQITDNHTTEILRELDFSKTSHLRRVVSVYLLNYDDSLKTERLRQRLNNVRNVDLVSLKKIFVAREYLFSNERFQNISRLFLQKLSVTGVIESFGLSNFYKASNFVQTALINFFRSNVANISDQFEILDELEAEFDTYKNIFPFIADTLIQSVALTGFGKKKCIEIFYRRLGDPRFGYMRFNWDKISEESKAIFLRWLVEDDLEIFFKIIKQTALDRMWKYREKFWRAYLPYISNTWIFLGKDAKRIARELGDKNMAHGNLESSSSNQSVFVFQIGRYIFSEWSHNGKLRVYKMESANHFFGSGSLSKWEIDENFIEAWIHSSPRTYSWQNKISEWLKINCGVIKTENDWGIED